jgi:polysaccharide deacetylase family protein (PEP-CTERM system associated)
MSNGLDSVSDDRNRGVVGADGGASRTSVRGATKGEVRPEVGLGRLPGHIVNAFTVDVEDYFHVAAFKDSIRREDWESMPSRVERNTRYLLGVLAENDIRATFFVLGWVAEHHPKLVREISESGHEVACHGYSHRLVYEQTPEQFRQETLRAKELLEDQTQSPVIGYRAASWSITGRSLWALDIIAELGFVYDSSIFPVHHDLYGLPGSERFPHTRKTESGVEIIEVPPSTVELFRLRLPIGGGGYFRLYPYCFSQAALRRLNEKERQPFVFYTHPWEIDVEQPRIEGRALSRFRHYNNLDKAEARLRRIVHEFRFDTVWRVLGDRGLASP